MIEQLKINILDTDHVTNCYLIWDEETKEAIIVDPADKEELIEEKIDELNLKVKYIVLTHAHKDHTIAVIPLIRKYNVKVIASLKEKDMLLSKYNDCSDVFGLQQVKYDLNDFILLNDGDKFNIGNTEIQIIHTPGHTRGSACYYIEKYNILITGDTVFSNCFGRCDLDTASIEDMRDSLCKLYSKYENTYIYPGHGHTNIVLKDTYNHVRRIFLYNSHIDLNEYIKLGGRNESF